MKIGIKLVFACVLITQTAQSFSDVMVGGYIDGNAWQQSGIVEFQEKSSENLAFVNFFASMSGRFDWHHRHQMNKILRSGAIPMLSYEPRFWDGRLEEKEQKLVLSAIANGDYDELFTKWINGYGQSWEIGFKQWAQENLDGAPMMFRFAHEMNGDWYSWGEQPEEYVAAWRHLYELFEENDVNQYLQWVWCPNETRGDAAAYYPGDDVVDWTCVDAYNRGSTYAWSSWRSFKDTMAPSYNFLVTNYPDKPIIIGEFGAYEPFDLPNGKSGDDADRFEDKEQWYEEITQSLEQDFPAIRAISTFNVGTYRIYGETFQGQQATGLIGWNDSVNSSYLTSDYLSVK